MMELSQNLEGGALDYQIRAPSFPALSPVCLLQPRGHLQLILSASFCPVSALWRPTLPKASRTLARNSAASLLKQNERTVSTLVPAISFRMLWCPALPEQVDTYALPIHVPSQHRLGHAERMVASHPSKLANFFSRRPQPG